MRVMFCFKTFKQFFSSFASSPHRVIHAYLKKQEADHVQLKVCQQCHRPCFFGALKKKPGEAVSPFHMCVITDIIN